MVKKVINYFASIITYTVILGLLSPIFDMVNILDTYKRIDHWLLCFLAVLTVYHILFYFEKVNPRKMYYCVGVFTTTIAILFSSVAFIVALIWIAILENIAIKIVFLFVSSIIYLTLIYIFVHRGVAVYKRGKIRIFKFSVKTYQTDKIEDYSFDYIGKKCVIHIIVSGNDHIFKIPSSSAKHCEQRFKSINCRNHTI
ncbi:MAG: hypothetical protein E7480_03940 [Ruminococcaceae bacterium]|nr:hypothetical protein [Oscillospiraceae bacterium]